MKKPMSKQECIDILTEMGYTIIYEPRVLLPEFRGGEVIEMSVFEAIDKLSIYNKTNHILVNLNNGTF